MIDTLARAAKNEMIKQTYHNTRKRRLTQSAATYEVKLTRNKLSKEQLTMLDQFFLEAKWLYNSVIAHGESDKIQDYDTKTKSVTVRMGKDSDEYEDRALTLPAQMKQGIHQRALNAISALDALKEKGRKVGALGYVKEVTSLPFKQHGNDFKILSDGKVRLVKVGVVRVRGLSQIPQDAEIASAVLIKNANDYYLKITCYIPLTVYSMSEWSGKPVLGLDMGISKTITLSDGRTFHSSIPVPRRIRKLQRKLSRQVKGSRNYRKTKNLIRKEWSKVKNSKNDLANKIVHEIMSSCSYLVIQDENISGWHKGLFGKQVQYSILGRVKALLVEHPRVIVIKRSCPTTQYCPECGALNKHGLDKRVYSCPCGYSCDRDVHAARNMILFACVDDYIKKYPPVECGSTLVESSTSTSTISNEEPSFSLLGVLASLGVEARSLPL